MKVAAGDSFYSNIDYQLVPSLPENALYFHAQYRQSIPNQAIPGGRGSAAGELDGQR